MRKAVIVGSAGQDGRILWGQLAARDYALIGVSRERTTARSVDWASRVDILDAPGIRDLIGSFMPDELYYLAAYHHSSEASGADNDASRQRSWEVNVHGYANFLDAVSAVCPATRVFHASSSRIFGYAETAPQNESTPRRPVCMYGVTKVAAMVLSDYHRCVHGLHVSSGILFNHESIYRAPQYITKRVVNGLAAIKRGVADTLEVGSLDAEVDWGFAPDYTRAMQLMLELEAGADFVVATGRTHSVRDLIAIAAAHMGLDWEKCVRERPAILTRSAQRLCGDSGKLAAQTGWKPSVDFAQMVRLLADDAMENPVQ